MSMTPEGRVKAAVKRELASHGIRVWSFMPVQNGMGSRAVDFIGCYRGRYFGIETKAPGKIPTALQQMTIRDIARAGGRVFVIDGTEDRNFSELRDWFDTVSREPPSTLDMNVPAP